MKTIHHKKELQMKKYKFLNKMILLILLNSSIYANNMNLENNSTKDSSTVMKHSIGSSLFLLGNFDSEDSPEYFQLNYGYQYSSKSIIIIEAITWTYSEPLGSYGSSNIHYPGKIKAYGLGIGYKHFLWKKLYSTILVTPFLQQFLDVNNKKIQNGFQLYLQSRLGYRFEFFDKHWFLEPSIAFNYWPINTNFPISFNEVEKGKSNFRFEPGLHFGYKF